MPLYTFRVYAEKSGDVEVDVYASSEDEAEALAEEDAFDADDQDWNWEVLRTVCDCIKQVYDPMDEELEPENEDEDKEDEPSYPDLERRIKSVLMLCTCTERSCPTCKTLSGS